MIEQILNMLRMDKHYNVHEFVEVAKGKYKIPTSVKEVFEQHRRQKNFKK